MYAAPDRPVLWFTGVLEVMHGVLHGRLRMQDVVQVWQHLKCLFGKGYKKKKVPKHYVCGKCAKETVDMLPTVQVSLDSAKTSSLFRSIWRFCILEKRRACSM